MFKQLAHICIGAHDLNQTKRFYCEVLGLEKGFDFVKGGRVIGFYIKVGENTFIEVFEHGHSPQPEHALLKHLCLEVDDMDAEITAVRERGWTISDKIMGADHTWQCWITDPGGVAIELQQYTDGSTQFTGADCLLD